MRRTLRSHLRRLVAVAAAVAVAGPAFAQARIPFPPIAGLIERPADWQPLPVPKPTLHESFAGECVPTHPELAWAALPRRLREVPLETMIGQLLVVSFTGKTPDASGVTAARQALAASRIGGVLYFRHNVGTAGDVKAINAILQDANPTYPAMIAVDQEGGAVTRIKPSEGAPETPEAARVAEGSVSEARKTYGAMASHLADLGFTANFGPVVDLRLNPDNPVIARFGRSYGQAPDDVVAYARAFARAHDEAGVATALKHFPGHGSSTADSHDGAIDLNPTWSRRELIPFRDLIASGDADMVMIGHLMLEGLSGPGGLPASLSPNAIDGFLRKTLCFDGLVVSDDLAMDAVADRWGAVDAAKQMIAAGGDIILLSLPAGGENDRIGAIIAAMAEQARESRLFRDKIRHAYARVVHHKLDRAEAARLTSRSNAAPPREFADAR